MEYRFYSLGWGTEQNWDKIRWIQLTMSMNYHQQKSNSVFACSIVLSTMSTMDQSNSSCKLWVMASGECEKCQDTLLWVRQITTWAHATNKERCLINNTHRGAWGKFPITTWGKAAWGDGKSDWNAIKDSNRSKLQGPSNVESMGKAFNGPVGNWLECHLGCNNEQSNQRNDRIIPVIDQTIAFSRDKSNHQILDNEASEV